MTRRSQGFTNREPRKQKRTKGKRMPRYMLDARGNVVPQDASPVDLWLCVHRESDTGKAWLVSLTGAYADAVWVPKIMLTIGESAGAIRAWHGARMVSVVVHWCSMPAFVAMEKNLIPKQGARAA